MRAKETTRRNLFGLMLWLAWAACCFAQPAALAEAERAIYRGNFSRAAAMAQSYLKTSPKSAAARVLLARARLAEGRVQEAYAELRRAVGDDPANVDALYYLGTLAAVLSESEFRQLYALAPDSARVHQLLAEAFQAQGNLAEAEGEYLAALRADPRSVESLTALGELKREQAKLDEAIDYYTRAEQAGGLDYDIAYGLGACYSIKQEHARAVEYLRRAVVFAPDAAAARFALGQSLFQLGEAEAAVAELKTAVALEPKMRQAYFLLGRAEQKLGRRAEAQAAFRKVEELSKAEFEADRGAGEPASQPPQAPRAGTSAPKRRRPPQ
jgi:tetratricopeptide (TPR) repeat protein